MQTAHAPRTQFVPRHRLLVRITHWINAAAMVLLLMSGLQIFNAHPSLYWGETSHFSRPWAAIRAVELRGEPAGATKIGPVVFESTGVLGWSEHQPRAFPAWATLPSYRSLADGRRWHFALAWIFTLNGLIYLAHALATGRLRRELFPRLADLKPMALLKVAADHARLRFPRGEAARRYNPLQQIAYLAVVLVLAPLMLATGLTMSPGLNAAWPWMLDLFGGRQSARTIHFLSASGLTLFGLVHLAMVIASGPWNQIRGMITGRFAIQTPGDAP